MNKSPLAVFAVVLACSATPTTPPTGSAPSSPPKADAGDSVTPDPMKPPPESKPVEPSPANPKDDGGNELGWAPAPLMTNVMVASNRDSALAFVPAVDGAVDYRVPTIPDGVKVSVQDGAERIDGSLIHCAGYRRHNAPRAAQRELMRQIEITAIFKPTRVVVEAIDVAGPYVGAVGPSRVDIAASNREIDAPTRGTFSIFTEQEVRAAYGSLIVNGHGNNPSKNGQPAPNVAPRVLARTTLKITPGGPPLTQTFFDDFQTNEQPVFVQNLSQSRAQAGKLYQSSKYSFYTFGAAASQFSFTRGQMTCALADWAQDIMSSNMAVPRRPVAISDSDYLHVTYEVQSNATSRRYW